MVKKKIVIVVVLTRIKATRQASRKVPPLELKYHKISESPCHVTSITKSRTWMASSTSTYALRLGAIRNTADAGTIRVTKKKLGETVNPQKVALFTLHPDSTWATKNSPGLAKPTLKHSKTPY